MNSSHRLYCGLVAAVMIFIASACGSETSYPQAVPEDQILKPVAIVAHRGGMAFAPENTSISVSNGQRILADIIELDVQVRGNEIIVLHDFTTARTADCRYDAADLDAAARQSCDAGYFWAAGSNTFSASDGFPYFRGKGVRVPLLDDVIGSAWDGNGELMLELKHISTPGALSVDQALSTLLSFIANNSISDKVLVNSDRPYVLSRVESMLPQVRTILSWGNQFDRSCMDTVLTAIEMGVDGVSLQANSFVESELGQCVSVAQNAGLYLMFWVVNRPDEVTRLLPFRPDALLTDFPACLVALLRDIRIPNPYPADIQSQSFLPKCG